MLLVQDKVVYRASACVGWPGEDSGTYLTVAPTPGRLVAGQCKASCPMCRKTGGARAHCMQLWHSLPCEKPIQPGLAVQKHLHQLLCCSTSIWLAWQRWA